VSSGDFLSLSFEEWVFVKPHKLVASYTIAQWLKEVLKLSDIADVSIFTANSTRSSSVSATADSGVTTNDILKAADWSTESVFRKFYYCPSQDPSYGWVVLSSILVRPDHITSVLVFATIYISTLT